MEITSIIAKQKDTLTISLGRPHQERVLSPPTELLALDDKGISDGLIT